MTITRTEIQRTRGTLPNGLRTAPRRNQKNIWKIWLTTLRNQKICMHAPSEDSTGLWKQLLSTLTKKKYSSLHYTEKYRAALLLCPCRVTVEGKNNDANRINPCVLFDGVWKYGYKCSRDAMRRDDCKWDYKFIGMKHETTWQKKSCLTSKSGWQMMKNPPTIP